MWDALYPQLPLEVVLATLSSVGLDATVNKIKNFTHPSPLERVSQISLWKMSLMPLKEESSHVSISPIDAFHASVQGNYPLHSTPREQAAGFAYPPTRATSPQALSVRIADDINPGQTTSSEWNEDGSRGDNNLGTVASPSNDYGTGVSARVGYIGLSSGATMLRAIQKFAPHNLAPTNTDHDVDKAFDSAALRSGRLTLSRTNKDHETLVLPLADEIGPLVEGFFRYFR